MKAAARLLTRQTRARGSAALRGLRAQSTAEFTGDRYLGPQLPLSLAPYRLRAADRWWNENGSVEDSARKRPS